MKIAFLSDMISFRDQLQSHANIKEVVTIESLEQVHSKDPYKGLIIDERNMGISELIETREQYPLLNILLLTEKQASDSLQTVCTAQDVLLLNKQYSVDELIKHLEIKWLHLENNDYHNVISVSGTHPQVGVTQTVFSIANALQSLNYKVGVIGLNLYNPGEIATEISEYSLDSIYSSLSNRMLEKNKLFEVMIEFDGFHYLVGNRNIRTSRTYQVEPIQYLIDQIKDEFDIVLLDLGSIYDTAPALAGLHFSSKHLLVSTQQEISARTFKRWNDQVFHDIGITPNDFLLVVNKFMANSVLTSKQLTTELETTLIGQIPYVLGSEDIEQEDGSLSYKNTSKAFAKAFMGISKALINKNEESPKRKKILGVL